MRIWLVTILCASMLAGCVPQVERPQARYTPPSRTAEQALANGSVSSSQQLRQCVAGLDRIVARYALLPDQQFSGSCHAFGAVRLDDIGTPTSNLGAMTCGLASAFTNWVQQDLQPIAQSMLGTRIARVESMGTYACRSVIGNAATNKLSEHAHANAVDIGGFVLEDGRRITIEHGWNASGDDGRFLRAVRAAACRRFQTVLSPDYNAAHYNHLHFDMGGRPFCR